MSKDSEGAYQDGKWEFDEKVADCFDDMLERSIPEYALMRELCFRIGQHFVEPNTAIVDLGCSRGGALARFVEALGPMKTNLFAGVEVSAPMRAAASDRFKDEEHVEIFDIDLRKGYPLLVTSDQKNIVPTSLTLVVLTLQFIPIEYRHSIVSQIYDTTIPGGALILVEKVLGNTGHLNGILVQEYYDIKREKGYSDEQIERKRLSLEGVLVPITARWNEDMLREAGFDQIDCFWRSLNFAGWVAVKK